MNFRASVQKTVLMHQINLCTLCLVFIQVKNKHEMKQNNKNFEYEIIEKFKQECQGKEKNPVVLEEIIQSFKNKKSWSLWYS